MSQDDYLRKTLDHYRQQRSVKVEQFRAEIQPIEAMIRQLEKELGESPIAEADMLQATDSNVTLFEFKTGEPKGAQPRPDEFFGMSQSDAAKTYLRRIGKAVSLDQLVEALQNGGAQLGGADPKKTLYVSLARNPLREFVNPREGYVGLREFYPSLPKAAKTSTPRRAKAKRKKPRKDRTVRVKNKTKAPESQDGRSPVREALYKTLSDGNARSPEEIVKALEGQGAKFSKISIYGALRSKEFTKEGEKYAIAK